MPYSCARPHATRIRRESHEEERTPAMHQPTHEEIARLAHSYWEARGHEAGSPDEDWFRAERTLAANGAKSPIEALLETP